MAGGSPSAIADRPEAAEEGRPPSAPQMQLGLGRPSDLDSEMTWAPSELVASVAGARARSHSPTMSRQGSLADLATDALQACPAKSADDRLVRYEPEDIHEGPASYPQTIMIVQHAVPVFGPRVYWDVERSRWVQAWQREPAAQLRMMPAGAAEILNIEQLQGRKRLVARGMYRPNLERLRN